MTETIPLKIAKSNFEKLRCSMCIGYLSCGPIRLLPDGSNICGHCSPSDDVLTYRQLALEAILSDAEFPCKYKDLGCATCLTFGHGSNHEDNCRYRLILCTSLNTVSSPLFDDCEWSGPLTKVAEHCMADHKKIVEKEAEFFIDFDESKDVIMMVVNSAGAFLITHEFDHKTFNLSYNVKHFLSNVEEVALKILLINETDPDYFLQVKGGKCSAFDDTLNTNTVNLNVNKYLDNLNSPESIKITLSMTVTKSTSDDSIETTELIVNYQTLEALRCSGCQYYLFPPAFFSRPNIICQDCSKTASDCQPCRNYRILSLMEEANYPCRWLECNFVGKGDVIRKHEISCMFRVYRCVFPGCSDTYKFDAAIKHLKLHKCQYFKRRVCYPTTLEEACDEIKTFTILEKEIILILSRTATENLIEHGHYLSVQSSSFDPSRVRVTVQFSHTHCKCKSKKMGFTNMLTVRFSDLPRCFEIEDELTAVLEPALI